MKLEIEKQYINKTWRYLIPSVNFYGEEFVRKFNPLFKIAAFVSDEDFVISGKNLHIAINKSFKRYEVQIFLNFLRKQNYYITEYFPEGNEKSNMLFIILQFPKNHIETFNNFIVGDYSKMYSSVEIKRFFKPPYKTMEFDILNGIKGTEAEKNFIKNFNQEFFGKLDKRRVSKLEDIEGQVELEIPPKIEEEIYNSKEHLKPEEDKKIFLKAYYEKS